LGALAAAMNVDVQIGSGTNLIRQLVESITRPDPSTIGWLLLAAIAWGARWLFSNAAERIERIVKDFDESLSDKSVYLDLLNEIESTQLYTLRYLYDDAPIQPNWRTDVVWEDRLSDSQSWLANVARVPRFLRLRDRYDDYSEQSGEKVNLIAFHIEPPWTRGDLENLVSGWIYPPRMTYHATISSETPDEARWRPSVKDLKASHRQAEEEVRGRLLLRALAMSVMRPIRMGSAMRVAAREIGPSDFTNLFVRRGLERSYLREETIRDRGRALVKYSPL
jgi:hypothetical protein